MQWTEIANTALVNTPPTVSGMGDPKNRVEAYSGGALKTSGSVYMIGAAGGHSDYAGNEVVALQLNTATPAWQEIKASTGLANIIYNSPAYLDHSPAAAHLYSNAHYIDQIGKYVVFTRGGISAGVADADPPPGDWMYNGENHDAYSKVFDDTTLAWEALNAASPTVAKWPVTSSNTDYPLSFKDPLTGDFYMSPNASVGWWKWTRSTNTWATTGGGNRSPWYAGAGVDYTRSQILVAGSYGGAVAAENPDFKNYAGTTSYSMTWGGLGRSAILTAVVGSYPGVVYVPDWDGFLIAYSDEGNSRTSFFRVDRTSESAVNVSVPAFTGVTPGLRPFGVHNSIQYVPELKGLFYQPSYFGNCLFCRTGI